MAQERSGENQEKTKASRGILATDGSGAASGRSERHNSSLYVHIDPKFRILFGNLSGKPTEDGRSTSVFSLWWQLSQDRMANFPAFIASKSFDL